MNYRTTCPQCASVFRLGANQLDAAQGWVQCGVCGAAFDARPSLLMEDGSPLPPPPEPEAVEAAPAAARKADEAALAETAATAPGEDRPVSVPDAESVTGADMPQGIVERNASPDLPSIILIDPNLPVPEDLGPLPQIYPAPSTYPPEAATSIYSSVQPPASAPVKPAARVEYAAALPGTARRPPAPRRITPWVWRIASAVLLGLLFAQATYFLRDTLVSRLPQTRPAFDQACAVLGCTLSLPKDLAQLQIVGSDLQTEASGRLKLTLTLGNRADHAQAWPVLVLTLTDQRNRPLARRSFAPSEYLGDAQRIAAGIPGRSEQALSLPLTVRDLAPMGFDLRLTY
ncbi:MAG: zinc-ribbon and DUF3426 domain-containing protein [Thiobacillus sp.]